jgi:hypothetical protein
MKRLAGRIFYYLMALTSLVIMGMFSATRRKKNA